MISALLPSLLLLTPSPAIEGNWKTGCLPIGRNGRHGFVTTLAVRGTTLEAVSQVYAHADCDTPTIRTRYRGRIVATGGQAGTIDLDHVVEAIEMTLDAADVVQVYNKPGSGCGFGGGWHLGTARSIEGRTCAPWTFPIAGTRLYERMWVDGGRLRVGSFPTAWTNVTPEARPTAPGMLVFTRAAD